MSDFWKVALTAVSLLGAVAIVFQLNKGNLGATAGNTITTLVGDAFSSGGATSSTNPTGGSTGGSNKHPNTTQYVAA